jgi:hypothetical protein
MMAKYRRYASHLLKVMIVKCESFKEIGKRFLFHKSTERIRYLKRNKNVDIEGSKEEWIYIHNLTEAIDELYADWNTGDITNLDTFIAISAYFKILLFDVCNENNIQLHKLYPIFTVPDEWKVEKNDIIQRIMMLLLSGAGIDVDTEDYRDRLLFIGELEAIMARFQLDKRRKQLLFIKNENRSIVYTLYYDEYLMKLKATYFKAKEDYNLRLFNEKYYSLINKSIHEIPICEEEEPENSGSKQSSSEKPESSIKHVLKKFIFEKLLKMDFLMIMPAEKEEDGSVADAILHDILSSFFVCLHSFHK